MKQPLVGYINVHLKDLLARYGFVAGEEDKGAMGESGLLLENPEFWIQLWRDRYEGKEAISIGSKVRPRPRAHLRHWQLSQLRGYLERLDDHYPFGNIIEEINWLKENSEQLFNSSFLNSEGLNAWAVKAARRHFG
jgi:hypothetical protein